ncbi:MAG TPA: alpha/beta hydrolase [Kofleriaceae bacterium]|nr:alpha/beta hydrolase [Kofleriaceae bacterium]
MDSQLVDTRVGTLHVESHGAGPAVVCWPSLYCDARTLDGVVAELGRDHRVIVIDGPGHGRSPAPPRALDFEACAHAAIDVLDALAIDRAVWFGPAWGGHVGVLAALSYPQRLAGLVILNAPMTAWTGKNRRLMQLGYAMLWLFGLRSFAARMIADKMISPTAPDRAALVDGLVAAIARCDRRGLLQAVRYAIARPSLVPRLPEITIPTLVIAGADDALLPVDAARREAAAIPDGRFVVVEHSSHQSALEAPAQVFPIVREALARWTRPTRATG